MGAPRAWCKHIPKPPINGLTEICTVENIGSRCRNAGRCAAAGHRYLMQVRFWGTRGSIPTPGHRTAVFGGNTSCVEIRTNGGATLVLDCGSGIRVLGLDMLRRP